MACGCIVLITAGSLPFRLMIGCTGIKWCAEQKLLNDVCFTGGSQCTCQMLSVIAKWPAGAVKMFLGDFLQCKGEFLLGRELI